ncbi:hypothetical protein GH714_003178 [Hevea brasiliensis]|uniref:NAC domain-containing protein n=1 Tax=Hevea brasiliensis TaxID=3981 RepID=A0A6A6LE90_HEVBR|nr:hypothetical protein GH714_003178 [Hevea brasiliensis]
MAYDYDHHYHHGASDYEEDAYLDSFTAGYSKLQIKWGERMVLLHTKRSQVSKWRATNRAAGKGYWKATGADKPVNFEGCKVGFRMALVFYQGKPPNGDKTDWIMHEYRVNEPPKRKRGGNDMKLDDWLSCRIYKNLDRSFRAPTRPRVQVVQDHQPPENGMLLLRIQTNSNAYQAGNIARIEMGYLNANAAYAPAYHLNGIGTLLNLFDTSNSNCLTVECCSSIDGNCRSIITIFFIKILIYAELY